MVASPAQVEQRADLVRASAIEIGATLGGIAISSIADMAKVADLLSRGMVAVPVHCREQPGVCFALAMQALEWGMPIMSVINKSYVPRNGDRIGYESQLLHAVVEKNAPLKGRLRASWSGEGDERRCKVWGTFVGETEPHEYESATLGKLHPGHSTKESNGVTQKFVKGSQVWDDNPDVQLFYSATRQWARLWCPDVLLGAYAREELDSATQMMDVTPKVEALAQRLKDAKATHATGRSGFDAEHVAREATASSIIEGDTNPGGAEQGEQDERVNEPDDEGRQDGAGDRSDGDRDQGGGEVRSGDDREVGGEPTGQQAARAEEGQGEIFPPDRDPSKPKARKR